MLQRAPFARSSRKSRLVLCTALGPAGDEGRQHFIRHGPRRSFYGASKLPVQPPGDDEKSAKILLCNDNEHTVSAGARCYVSTV